MLDANNIAGKKMRPAFKEIQSRFHDDLGENATDFPKLLFWEVKMDILLG